MLPVTFVFTDQHRDEYAAELLREPDAFKAALQVFGDKQEDIARVAYVAATWPKDPDIIRRQRVLLKDKKIADLLPSKEAVVHRLWTWCELTTVGIDDKLKAIKLMADISGWIAKPETTIPINFNTTNNVMVVKEKGASDDEWEKSLKKQQQELTKRDDESTAVRH